MERSLETTVGRLIFNQILPPTAALSDKTNRPMDRTALREVVADCYRVLGRIETAHLVDGIKTVGFHYATQGGMTIAVGRHPRAGDKPDLLARPTGASRPSTSSTSAVSSPRTSATSSVVERLERTPPRRSATPMMDGLDPEGSVDDDDLSGARGNKGNIGQLGGMRGLMADPSGRIIDVPDALQLPRGHDRPGVLHLHPRRPQGSRRHRPPHRRLGLPDPAPGGRRAGRHHPR